MPTAQRKSPRYGLLILPLLLATLACGVLAPEPTPTSTPSPVPPTDTATPTPTDTPTPTPDRAATRSAESTEEAEAAIADIDAYLQDFNINYDTSSGNLGWLQDEDVRIRETNFGTYQWDPVADGDSFDNFLLHVNITWDSTSGLAGCGIILRSSDREPGRGEHYRYQSLRLSGAPAWDVEYWKDGDYVSTTSGQVRTNSAIRLGANSTNEYLVVMDGTLMTIYANGTRLSNVTVSTLSDGRIFFFTFQESGATTCTFHDGWIWELAD